MGDNGGTHGVTPVKPICTIELKKNMGENIFFGDKQDKKVSPPFFVILLRGSLMSP